MACKNREEFTARIAVDPFYIMGSLKNLRSRNGIPSLDALAASQADRSKTLAVIRPIQSKVCRLCALHRALPAA